MLMENEMALEGARVAFSLAARLVHDEPTDADIRAYLAPGFFDAAPFGEGDAAVGAGLSSLRAWAAASLAGEEGADAGSVRRDWLQLIGGAGSPKAPSWAGWYLNPNSQLIGPETLPVRRLYASWGLAVARQGGELDDDLGVMLGFLAHLIGEEASDGGRACEARGAQEELLREHILPWICSWRWSMAKYARTGFYRGAGELVFGFIRTYAARFGFMHKDDNGTPRFVVG